MLKKISMRKIVLSSLALFAMFLIYIIPSNQKLNIEKSLEYVSYNVENSPIFLIDKNNYVSLTSVAVNEESVENKAKELIKILTIGSDSSKLPNGFRAVIPPNTEVLSLNYENNLIKVDFSKELLNINKKLEEKMVEAIVYTLTSIDGVDKVIIYVEGDILTKLPKSKINLPSTLDRSFGINKEFNLTSTKNIVDVTIYYINEISGNYYYVPVTKYLNDDDDKIDIIIQQLSKSSDKNLKSYLNENIKLISKDVKDDMTTLNFNKNINLNNALLKETLDVIALSVKENYNVKTVVFNADGKKLYDYSI